MNLARILVAVGLLAAAGTYVWRLPAVRDWRARRRKEGGPDGH